MNYYDFQPKTLDIVAIVLAIIGLVFALFPLIGLFAYEWPSFFSKPGLFLESLIQYLTAQFVGAAIGIPCLYIAYRVHNRLSLIP